MPKSSKEEIITKIKPHTVVKIELIERYVERWARKILGFKGKAGQSPSKGVIFIDCMSNSGLYYDENNNIIEGTGIRVAKKLNDIITNYPGKKAVLIFNDQSAGRIERLEEEIKKRNLNNIEVHYNQTDCNDLLRGLNTNDFNKSFNTLLLYDPYNASIDWDAISPYLNQWGEVIINHMVYDTNLNLTHTTSPILIKRYMSTYQDEIESIIEKGTSKKALNDIILSIIEKRTQNSRYDHYIAYFPFFNRSNGLVYYLLHCSVNIEGIKLFKEIAWKTFGDKSAQKNTTDPGMQLSFDFENNSTTYNPEYDESECFFVYDIAKYVFDKYHTRKEVYLSEIYDDLDKHPIFPSDGYKNEIRDALKEIYHVEISGKPLKVFFYDQGAF